MMTNTESRAITLEEARKIATDMATYDTARDVKDKSIPLLQDGYLEADYCWMFFRNKVIVIAPERALSDCAYCVSKMGHGRSIPDYSNDPIRLQEYLQTMSNHFKERGL
ncbi:hypothetical protein P3T24_006591 [Paraburkholderia sp. GAS33]|uniref:hypothetical protein n=1 Tax=Paraburkholderia sp. GAS33 TaxID=3035130 RepID=UPI003D1E5335